MRSLNFNFYRVVDPFLSVLRVWSWNLNSFRQKSLSPPRTARLLERASNRLEGRQRLIHFNLFSTSHFNFAILRLSYFSSLLTICCLFFIIFECIMHNGKKTRRRASNKQGNHQTKRRHASYFYDCGYNNNDSKTRYTPWYPLGATTDRENV